MSRTIHVGLDAGIGNRLFKYASAKGIAAKLGCQFNVLDNRVDHEHHQNTYEWFLQRISADISAHLPDANECCMIYNQPDSEHVGVKTSLTGLRECEYEHLFLGGYYQSEANFAHIKNELRYLLCRESPAITEALDAHYPNASSCIAIHVRIGDYVKAVNVHKHFVNLQVYYERCITALRKERPGAHFLIVCEDAENIPHVYPNLLPFIAQANTYSIANTLTHEMIPHIDPSELDLYLLARCAGVVCSNSTFAWWGAWIGLNRDSQSHTKVFIPDKWLHGHPHAIEMNGAIMERCDYGTGVN